MNAVNVRPLAYLIIGVAACGSPRLRDARDIAASLATDVGPRLAGSPGDHAAVAWAERTMRELGLSNVHTEPVMVPVWRRGVEKAELVESHQGLAVTALGWSGPTPEEGIVADVVEVGSLEALAQMPKDAVAGKIVFANVVMPRTDDGHGYGKTVPVRLFGPKAAMDAGAAAFVVRSLSTSTDHDPHAGSTALREVANPIAAGALATADADLLHATLARGAPVKMKLVLRPERGPDAPSANVVGEVPGAKKPDEVVLLGAHLDSWDLARGAIDDGAGCGIVLQAARVIAARHRPSRTVRVVLFAAEENSVAGAKAYAAVHAPEVDKIILAMEADSGTDRARYVKLLGDPAKAAAFERIAHGLERLGIARADGDARPGTDVAPLVALGVPTIEVRQDATRYFDIHHSALDTPDKLDADALAQVSSAFAEIALGVADLDGDLGRVPEAKRKAE
jgi:carboxypeptidase Q